MNMQNEQTKSGPFLYMCDDSHNESLVEASGFNDAFHKLVSQSIENADSVGEPLVTVLSRLGWPMTIREFQHQKICYSTRLRKAKRVIEYLLEELDEDYGDGDNYTAPDKEMEKAASVFVNAVADRYPVWIVEATGRTKEFQLIDALNAACQSAWMRQFNSPPMNASETMKRLRKLNVNE